MRIYDIYRGVGNVLRWAPVVWEDRDWDWCYLSRIMRYKLLRMAQVSEHGHHVRGAIDAKQMRVCAALLWRLEQDEYLDNAELYFGVKTKAAVQHWMHQQRQDQRYLGLLLGKYLTNWWD